MPIKIRISSAAPASAKPSKTSPAKPVEKSFSRSPYREQTRMVRVPKSLLPMVLKMLEKRKAVVAAGDPDAYV